MLQSFSRAYLEAIDQAHLGMSDTVAGNLRSRRWGDTPSMKRHGHPFPVTGDALKGACFLPILGWCRHDDSHFLRALGTKQCPGVSKDCLVRHILVHRHDEFPSRREVKNILIEVIPLVRQRAFPPSRRDHAGDGDQRRQGRAASEGLGLDASARRWRTMK
jgi:hypothetical protein